MIKHFELNALTEPVTSREGMTHAILQSIHNHAEATQNDQARMDNQERGGSWSHELLVMVGSRDWTLAREKITPQTISLAKRFYQESVKWLIDEGHARSIEVNVWQQKPNQISRNLMVTLTDGSKFELPLSEVKK